MTRARARSRPHPLYAPQATIPAQPQRQEAPHRPMEGLSPQEGRRRPGLENVWALARYDLELEPGLRGYPKFGDPEGDSSEVRPPQVGQHLLNERLPGDVPVGRPHRLVLGPDVQP